MRKHKLVLAMLGLFQTLSAFANSDERLDHFLSLRLEELAVLEVTISTNTRQTLTKAPAVVTVITAEDIKATGATNLVDVLQGVPGIYVRASQFGNRPLIHIRGANAAQTLLMVNGAPMKDLVWGFGIFWKGLPASMIERVEIIRGPGSALYGADATAGVINVITKTAGKIAQSEAGLRAGGYGAKTGWLQHGADWNGYDINLTAEISDTNGHDPFIANDGRTATVDSDYAGYGWRNEDIRFSMGKGNWRWHVDYVRHSDLETGLSGAGVLDPITHGEDSRFNTDLFYSNEQFAKDWGLNAELRYQDLDYSSGEGFQEAPGDINQQQAAERRVSGEVSGLYSGIRGHAIRLGAGHIWQDIYSVQHVRNSEVKAGSAAFAPEKSRTISYLFLQDEWALASHWELTAGLRYDHYSDFGNTLNPRLALVWQSTDTLTAKLMYGQAFRAPSFQELYSDTSTTLSNSALAPERSRTWDLAFSYAASKDLQLGLNLYHFAQSDLIAGVVTPPTKQYQNAGEHTIHGVEVDAKWQASKTLRVSGSYTIRDHQDTDNRDVFSPDWEAYLRTDWAFRPKWNWNVQANLAGERPRKSTDTRQPVDAYTLVDTTIRYSPTRNWAFAASVRNLFDADARDYTGASLPDDLPLPGRHFYAELRYTF